MPASRSLCDLVGGSIPARGRAGFLKIALFAGWSSLAPPEGLRRDTESGAEQPAKRSQTLEADRQADIRHRPVRAGEQMARTEKTPAHEVLVRCLAEGALEHAEEVMRGEAGDPGDLLQRDGPIQVRFHIVERVM